MVKTKETEGICQKKKRIENNEGEMDNGPTTSSFEILCKTLGIKTIAALDATKESVRQYSTCSMSKNQHLAQLAAIYEPLCNGLS